MSTNTGSLGQKSAPSGPTDTARRPQAAGRKHTTKRERGTHRIVPADKISAATPCKRQTRLQQPRGCWLSGARRPRHHQADAPQQRHHKTIIARVCSQTARPAAGRKGNFGAGTAGAPHAPPFTPCLTAAQHRLVLRHQPSNTPRPRAHFEPAVQEQHRDIQQSTLLVAHHSIQRLWLSCAPVLGCAQADTQQAVHVDTCVKRKTRELRTDLGQPT